MCIYVSEVKATIQKHPYHYCLQQLFNTLSLNMSRYVSAAFPVLLLLVAIAEICLCVYSSVPCREAEREALLNFKASLHDPINRLYSWKGIHCCQWKGVGCDNVTGHVVKLDLRSPCVPPSWPKDDFYVAPQACYTPIKAQNVNQSLLQLEYLTYLDLSGYDFSLSPIPTFFGSMQHLQYLSLSSADFSGTIPSSLGKLKNLQLLDLGWNYELEANDISWISELESLEHLNMGKVYFKDTDNLFQVLNMLPSLLRVYLPRCGLYNSLIPLTKVQVLDLNENQLTLSALHAFQNMTSLVHLYLSGNLFNGPIPNALRNLTSIEFLDLSVNNITSIPSWFHNFEKLVSLDLSSNGLHGPIPNAFQNMPSLKFLHLRWNYFTSVPSWFNNFKKLKLLDLSCNGLHDTDEIINCQTSLETRIYHIGFGGADPDASKNGSSLVHLDLSRNVLGGPLPDCFMNMTSIELLYLSGNRYSSIPSWFGNFEKLVELDLSMNMLHGPIPDCFRNMTSIEFLYLSGNKHPSIPSWFGNFEKLVELDLSMNMLQGPIPKAFRNLSSIEFLDLSINGFTLVPSWFPELKSLVHVDLQQNNLTHMDCSLSSVIGSMCHLKSLDLSGYKLRGEPFGHNELSGCIRYDLEELYLGNNDFSAHLPTWLGKLENLRYLDLSSNLFHGSIPFSLGKLSKLVLLDLSNNKLNGPIPFSLGKLSKLNKLDLSNNQLNETLPHNIGELVSLFNLNLSSNEFNGFIPQSLGKLVNLEYFDLSDNFLHGSIPQNIYQITYLDLSSNNLDGIISIGGEWSSITKNVGSLNLANNQISGSLPKNIGHIMPYLENLFLGNNLINGSIPVSLCQTQFLKNLDLSNNNLSGKIPNCWKDNKMLEEINLSSNKLSGVFPSSFGNISSLWWLHLNNNNLRGRLPVSLRNLEQLLILDLGENQLSGNIPPWTTSTFPSLQILRLRQNVITGKIPLQLCQLTSLKILDLSRNKLEGSIPWCIGNLTGMTLNKSSNQANAEVDPLLNNSHYDTANVRTPEWYKEEVKEVMKGTELDYIKILKLVVIMDLSENNLVGAIPNGITWLTGLHGLNLSNNNLKGEIPKMIGDMKSLESFDMSHNLLSGIIPDSISALTSLSHLNLSHNNLSGPIPQGNQLSTLDDPSIYADNPYLCGSPLPNKCSGNDSQRKGNESDDDNKDKVEKIWLFFVIAVGFATGFWGVIGTLWFKKGLRLAYFGWVDKKADDIYVAMVIKMAKLKQLIHR